MIEVTLKFESIDAAISFLNNRPAPSDAPMDPPTPIRPAPQAVEGPQANATRRGRPKKTETPQPEVGQNTGTSSPVNQTSGGPATSANGAPQGDAGAETTGAGVAPTTDAPAPVATAKTLKDLQDAAMRVMQKFPQEGMAKLAGMLTTNYGVKLLRDVPAEKFADAVKACDDLCVEAA